jgi:hypothetical protein
MTEPSNIKLTSQHFPLSLPNNIEKGGLTTMATGATEQTSGPLFRHYEKNLVLFAYNREVDEDPPH